MEIGQRVVRGESWKWDDQDGGEGGVGTIVVIGRPESLSSPDKTVLVQWDLGARTNYRCGYDDAYDLYLLDNGPIGVIHNNASCSGCNEQRIKGLLWKCARCSGCHLCSTCYHNDVHSLKHQFCRIETPNSAPVLLSKRQGKQRIQSKGTFTRAVVARGPDWEWDNQDDVPQQNGRVTDVKGWNNETFRSVVSVTWTNNVGNVYRRGHKGKVDVKSVTPSEGGFYYKDHLPKVCSSMPFASSPTQSTPQAFTQLQQEFACGDEVRIILDVDVLKSLQRDYGWTEKFVPVIGMMGTVLSRSVSRNNGIVVKFPQSLSHSATELDVNPLALSKVEKLQVKDKVYILNNLELVKKLQTGHGEWTDAMEHILGKEGLVQKFYPDGDVKVLVGNTSWTLNPAILTKKTNISPVQQQLGQDPASEVYQNSELLLNEIERMLCIINEPVEHGEHQPHPNTNNHNTTECLTLFSATDTSSNIMVKETNFRLISELYRPHALDSVYKMTSSPRGLAVIVNMNKFDPNLKKLGKHDEKLENREGSEVDANNLEKLFKALDLEVEMLIDKTEKQLMDELLEISKRDLKAYDCFVMCIMSHGKDDYFYSHDGGKIKILDVKKMFNNASCQTLCGKPKLFFIQACRGKSTDFGCMVGDTPSAHSENESASDTPAFICRSGPSISENADILLAYSSVEGYTSYRNTINGSRFIRFLVWIFQNYAGVEDVESMMTRVIKEVNKAGEIGNKQVPKPETTLTRKVFFWPGIKFPQV